MVILTSDDVELVPVSNTQMQERYGQTVARYNKRVYWQLETYNELDQAIAACRTKLDSGFFCIIVRDANHKQGLWQQVPERKPA